MLVVAGFFLLGARGEGWLVEIKSCSGDYNFSLKGERLWLHRVVFQLNAELALGRTMGHRPSPSRAPKCPFLHFYHSDPFPLR